MRRGRPKKVRIIRKDPEVRQFSPRGRRGRPGDSLLKFEELEAIRLADHMGLSQKDAAQFMGVSQQTFSRVLKNARGTVSEALVKGKIIRVYGGDYKVTKY